MNQSIEMLSTALKMEEKGQAFYNKAITTCTNPLGQDIFRTLAKDEVMHVNRIKVIYDSLSAGKGWTNDWTGYKFEHGELISLFRDLAQKYDTEKKAETSDLEALDVGIDFEQKSVTFYEQHLKNASDPIEKKFTEQMVIEEKSHLAVLKDTKHYLENPAAWYAEMEKQSYDG